MSAWHDVGSLDELERTGRLVATIAGREVGVVADPATGALFGLRNRCPHHGAPLCLGAVRERVAGSVASYELSGTAVLRCPWHGWEFDVETGRCPEDPIMRVAVYPVRIEDGRVLAQA